MNYNNPDYTFINYTLTLIIRTFSHYCQNFGYFYYGFIWRRGSNFEKIRL